MNDPHVFIASQFNSSSCYKCFRSKEHTNHITVVIKPYGSGKSQNNYTKGIAS